MKVYLNSFFAQNPGQTVDPPKRELQTPSQQRSQKIADDLIPDQVSNHFIERLLQMPF